MACCQSEALAVVASGRADDAADVRALSPETIEIDKASPDLESANGCVILVLYDDRAPEAFGEKGPSIFQAYCGVGGIAERTMDVAQSRSSSVNIELPLEAAQA
jgi:hypothetical protein